MVSSNRYGQEIADVLTNLRTDKKVINASSGKTGYIPTVIIFDDASIDVEGNHEAIIPSETWELVQEEMERRRNMDARYSSASIFFSKIKCSECGNWYGSKVWHSNSKYRRTVWQCNAKFKGESRCATPCLYEQRIKELFLEALGILMEDRETAIADCRAVMEALTDCSRIDGEAEEVSNEMEAVAGMIQRLVDENATRKLDQEDYRRKYAGYAERCAALESRMDGLKKERERREI